MKQYVAHKTTMDETRILDINLDSFDRAKKIVREDYEENQSWRNEWVEYGIEIWKLDSFKRVLALRGRYKYDIHSKEFIQVR